MEAKHSLCWCYSFCMKLLQSGFDGLKLILMKRSSPKQALSLKHRWNKKLIDFGLPKYIWAIMHTQCYHIVLVFVQYGHAINNDNMNLVILLGFYWVDGYLDCWNRSFMLSCWVSCSVVAILAMGVSVRNSSSISSIYTCAQDSPTDNIYYNSFLLSSATNSDAF